MQAFTSPASLSLLYSPADEPALLDDWHVVAFSTDVKPAELIKVTLIGRDLVLWRDSAGQAHAWEDLCIHRGARLSKGWVEADTVVCPYHGWRYDGSAKCVHVPSAAGEPPPQKARAFPYMCKESDGFIWVSVGTPDGDPPAFPEASQEGFRLFHAGPYTFRANGFRAVENFLDATHFPFVHGGLNGVTETPDQIQPYEVYQEAGGPFTSEIKVFQPFGDHRQVPVHAWYTYRCLRPLVAHFSKRVQMSELEKQPLNGPNDRFCTFFTAQPLDEVNCIVRIAVAINFGPELTESDVRQRQDVVYNQDREIVETQRPERIPLDMRAELHHRTDRLGQTYRRWLTSLGIRYGVV